MSQNRSNLYIIDCKASQSPLTISLSEISECWHFKTLPTDEGCCQAGSPQNFQILSLVDKYSSNTFFWKAQRSNISPPSPEETNTSLKSFFETEIKQFSLLPLHLPPSSTVTNKMWTSQDIFLQLPKQQCTFYIQTQRNGKAESEKGRDEEGKKGAVIDCEHMEEIEARTDIQHVISFDRPAHPSTFWLGDLRGWGYYEISTHSPQLPLSLSVSLLSLPPFLFLSPTASHSPLLLSLFSLARSSLSPTQLYSTGIEMGLSLPAARRRTERQYHTAAHTHIKPPQTS